MRLPWVSRPASLLSQVAFTGHRVNGYCLGLGSAERVGVGLDRGYWASVCFVYWAQAVSPVPAALYSWIFRWLISGLQFPSSRFSLFLWSRYFAGLPWGTSALVGSGSLLSVAGCPFLFKLRLVAALAISHGGAGHFAFCSVHRSSRKFR